MFSIIVAAYIFQFDFIFLILFLIKEIFAQIYLYNFDYLDHLLRPS